MTFSTNDFHREADELLRELGYEICGDDDEGWAFHFGGPDSTTRGPQVDTAAQASASTYSRRPPLAIDYSTLTPVVAGPLSEKRPEARTGCEKSEVLLPPHPG